MKYYAIADHPQVLRDDKLRPVLPGARCQLRFQARATTVFQVVLDDPLGGQPGRPRGRPVLERQLVQELENPYMPSILYDRATVASVVGGGSSRSINLEGKAEIDYNINRQQMLTRPQA